MIWKMLGFCRDLNYWIIKKNGWFSLLILACVFKIGSCTIKLVLHPFPSEHIIKGVDLSATLHEFRIDYKLKPIKTKVNNKKELEELCKLLLLDCEIK